jgi:AmmeMemoRadiSam system protein B
MRGELLLRWAWLALLVPAALLAASFFNAGDGGSPDAEAPPVEKHPALFYNERDFVDSLRAADAIAQPQGRVAGGIIPHHLLAGHLIDAFFRGLATDPPATVVLIGPNHDKDGSARVLTSRLSWDTPYGAVEPDLGLIDSLVTAGLVSVQDPVLTTEHSVAGIMPAVQYYLPDARVVPLILSGDVAPVEAQRLAGALAERADGDTVFVAAVDFSHYLVASEAARRDTFTLQALHTNDASVLFTLNDQYLDSPPSIAVLIETMRALGAGGFVLLEHTNSGELLNDLLVPTTSYFMGYYSLDAASVNEGR